MDEPYPWFLGIDWGYHAHQLTVVDATGTRHGTRRVDHDAAAIADALAWVLAAATSMVALVRGERALAALPLFFAVCVLGDALVCSALSGVFDRYQARVIWLLPMAALLCLICVRDGSRQRLGGA